MIRPATRITFAIRDRPCTTLSLRAVALEVRLPDPGEQEDVVVHREPEQDREHHDRDERDDRRVAVDAEQRRAPAPLEDRDDHAVGGADRQQVEDGRRQRHPDRAEHRHQQQDREADDDRDEHRQTRGDLVREVLEPGGLPADVDVEAAALRRRGDGVRSQPVDEVGRRGVLRRGRRRHREDRRVPALVEARRRDRRDAGRLREVVAQGGRASPCRARRRSWLSIASSSGPLKPGPNALDSSS